MNSVQQSRINSLDFIRGIAILCILLINIESFAYPNPWGSYQYGFMTDADSYVRYWVYVFAQGKFYGLLAMLFGAGLTIIIQKQPYDFAIKLSAARLLSLFLIGIVHAYLVWSGDILYHYAVIGMIAVWIIVLGPNVTRVGIAICATIILFFGYSKAERTNVQYQAYQKALSVKEAARSHEQKKVIERWQNRTEPRVPTHRTVAEPPSLTAYWQDNFDNPQVHKGKLFYSSIFWSTLMMMLIGSQLYLWGLFSKTKFSPFAVVTLCCLIALSCYATQARYFHWLLSPHTPVLSYSKQLVIVFNRELQAIVYLVLLSLIYNRWLYRFSLLGVINTIGRFALSNYLLQSVVLMMIFYGVGLHNSLSRSELVLLWGVMVVVQLLLNVLYGHFCKVGPVERIWRKLTIKLHS
ncbi:DUF418 domain-containing protein [Pseudoalteromonas piscicida]|uniref:DUF418 domain-containing protein n=1 Tax=Pseudoalteromonas piscicida TaxID=43662 RepID=A0A2A5JT47_PSEO7|nr:DUF418 domain-containing protein [Pseudoalteromonas piscicida]PCK32451.1 hypothetical protein CEX98_06910 [Pseudoalteromonas piscicida]